MNPLLQPSHAKFKTPKSKSFSAGAQSVGAAVARLGRILSIPDFEWGHKENNFVSQNMIIPNRLGHITPQWIGVQSQFITSHFE